MIQLSRNPSRVNVLNLVGPDHKGVVAPRICSYITGIYIHTLTSVKRNGNKLCPCYRIKKTFTRLFRSTR